MKKRTFGTHDIARICHVTPPTIGRWIEEGKLPSFKTGGGHRRVWDTDLVVFLKDHNIPVPDELKITKNKKDIKILVVDDEPEMRRFVARVIKKMFQNADIEEAGDGFEAGHKIATLLPVLVILDLRLPGLDGFKVCQTVKMDPKLKDVRILAITGYGVEESRKHILNAGADAFLPKPFNAEELKKAIEKMNSFSSAHFRKKAL